jgi:hypothetical protein
MLWKVKHRQREIRRKGKEREGGRQTSLFLE